MKKTIISFLIILIFSVIASYPLLKPGLYTIHDDQQVARLYVFDEALKSGQFPVRWVNYFGFGYGYPLFNFYPPTVYAIAEFFHLLGFGFVDSIKITFFLSILLSGVGIFILSKELWGRAAGLLSSIFYIFVPYRAVDVYIRGALAESFSFVWLPLILWAYIRLEKTNKNIYILSSGIFLALLMVTHNLILLPFLLILPFFLLFLAYKSRDKRAFFIKVLISGIIGGSLSAFFSIPALMEKKFTIVDDLLLLNLANFNIHFVYPNQLWDWPWGYAGSGAGLTDGISFKIGKLHVVLSIISTLLALVLSYFVRNKKNIINYFSFIFVFFFLLIFSAIMTTYLSRSIWDLVSPLGYLQFPWRFLTFTSLFGSLMVGSLIFLVRLPVIRIPLLSILIILVLFSNLKLFTPQRYREALTDEVATEKSSIKWDVSYSSYEYIPKGVELTKNDFGNNFPRIERNHLPESKIGNLDSLSDVKITSDTPTEFSFDVKTQEEKNIILNTFNFPGWTLYINNQKSAINSNNPLNLVSFNLPKGQSHVELSFENTPIRTISNTISLLSLLSVFSYLLLYFLYSVKNKAWIQYKNK